MNDLGLRFQYKLKINPAYTELLNILDKSEYHNYQENEKATRSAGANLRNLEERYMEEHKKIEEGHLAQQLSWLLKKLSSLL